MQWCHLYAHFHIRNKLESNWIGLKLFCSQSCICPMTAYLAHDALIRFSCILLPALGWNSAPGGNFGSSLLHAEREGCWNSPALCKQKHFPLANNKVRRIYTKNAFSLPAQWLAQWLFWENLQNSKLNFVQDYLESLCIVRGCWECSWTLLWLQG